MNTVEQIASGYGNFSYTREKTARETDGGTEFAKHIGQNVDMLENEKKGDRYHSKEENNTLSIDNVDRIVYNMWGIIQHTGNTRGELMNIVT